MARSKPLESISAEINATLRESRSSFATSRVALRFLAQCHRSGRLRPVAALPAFDLGCWKADQSLKLFGFPSCLGTGFSVYAQVTLSPTWRIDLGGFSGVANLGAGRRYPLHAIPKIRAWGFG